VGRFRVTNSYAGRYRPLVGTLSDCTESDTASITVTVAAPIVL